MKKVIFVMLIVLLWATACAPASKAVRDSSNVVNEGAAMGAPAPVGVSEAPMVDSAEYSKGVSSGVPASDRMVIKTVNISIVVTDPAVSMDTIAKMADAMGGWVVTSNLYKTTTRDGVEIPQASISIRVPAERLTEAMDRIKDLVTDPKTDIQNENVSGQDVTAEFTDLSSRKKNLEIAEAQLQKILESATKTEDVLSVFNQLTQVRSDIEVLKGQMKYYQESASFSSISVEVISKESIKPITVAGWQPQGIARDAVQALLDTLKVLVNILIYFVILVLPVLLALFGFIKFLIWLFRLIFRRKNKKAAQVIETAESPKK